MRSQVRAPAVFRPAAYMILDEVIKHMIDEIDITTRNVTHLVITHHISL